MLRKDKSQYIDVSQGNLVRSNVPRRFWSTTIDKVHKSALPLVKQFMRRLDKHICNGDGLYIHGKLKTGKTALSCHIAKEVMHRGGRVYFVQAQDIPFLLFRNFTHENEEFFSPRERITDCDLMIVDDLGAEAYDPRSAAGAALEWVIRQRYNEKRSLIITSNFSPAQLAVEDKVTKQARYTEALRSIIGRTTMRLHVEKE